ncbi:hypothetical protein BN1088_140011 [Sphingobacterium sp. PM2-P1-29]|nr:hypothetical protein BN1088_140011 [Sphingobacterium sp. PM2-P1-29]
MSFMHNILAIVKKLFIGIVSMFATQNFYRYKSDIYYQNGKADFNNWVVIICYLRCKGI